LKLIKQNEINLNNFERLFKKHYVHLCLYALKYINNEVLAEEIVQDVFCKIWEKRKYISIAVSFKSYLYITVRNKCLQEIKHQKVINNYNKHIENFEKSNLEGPHENLIYKETAEILNDILETLPGRCSEIFKLSRFEGLKYSEIAKQLSISIKTVEANISKALKTFKLYFPEYK